MVTQLGARDHPRQLSDAQRAELAFFMKQGTSPTGFATDMWTLRRIAVLIEEKFGIT